MAPAGAPQTPHTLSFSGGSSALVAEEDLAVVANGGSVSIIELSPSGVPAVVATISGDNNLNWFRYYSTSTYLDPRPLVYHRNYSRRQSGGWQLWISSRRWTTITLDVEMPSIGTSSHDVALTSRVVLLLTFDRYH